jgi:hypothetical protein
MKSVENEEIKEEIVIRRRKTVDNQLKQKARNMKEAEKYKGLCCFAVTTVRGTLHPQRYMRSDYEINEETRDRLDM